MINFVFITDHPYRLLVTGGSAFGKTDSLFNLIIHQPDVGSIYLYAKDPFEAKYQSLFNKRKRTGINHLNDFKAFTECMYIILNG